MTSKDNNRAFTKILFLMTSKVYSRVLMTSKDYNNTVFQRIPFKEHI